MKPIRSNLLRHQNRTRTALTLVELLVVLAILAVMTTLAVTMTDGLVDQGRYEATQRTMEVVRQAICGDPNLRNEDGTPLTTGFVSDFGRPPTNLTELYQTPAIAGVLSSTVLPASDTEVAVFFPGWRTYIQPSAQQSFQVLDGWGQNLNYDSANGTLSFSRGTVSGSGPYENISLQLPLPCVGSLSANAKLSFPTGTDSPTNLQATDKVVVRIYWPYADASGRVVKEKTFTAQTVANTNGNAVYGFINDSATGSPMSLPIGPKYLRAYVLDSSDAVKFKSQIVRFHLPASGRPNLPTLYITIPQTTTTPTTP